MAQERLSVRKIRDILRLRFERGRSQREIARSVGVSKTAITECLHCAKKAGISWPLPEDADDTWLETTLYPQSDQQVDTVAVPDWAQIHVELRKKGVTKMLLWHEYRLVYPDGMSYTRFCERFDEWLKKSRLSMRQIHKAGEKLFVDFAGATLAVHTPKTGAVEKAQIFVATWGASNFTFAKAVWAQDVRTWVSCHVDAFDFFGCVPEVVVPDNLKSGVSKACRYDPDINPTYAGLASHYGFAVSAATL